MSGGGRGEGLVIPAMASGMADFIEWSGIIHRGPSESGPEQSGATDSFDS
jgi:hypothetical protein